MNISRMTTTSRMGGSARQKVRVTRAVLLSILSTITLIPCMEAKVTPRFAYIANSADNTVDPYGERRDRSAAGKWMGAGWYRARRPDGHAQRTVSLRRKLQIE